ncbi:hypothetical protein [Ferrimonas marina]|uniref:Uncharacterized protein n=1 Tax=Ferrimonas marina TaxID=299255 RepID=A0A1M5U7G8_9GAMM|nr:hypothetical protein [Ferrimonas marina]SHH58850.1 hypothetical protein SAMN02745129_2437 [Ferrimonas marina]
MIDLESARQSAELLRGLAGGLKRIRNALDQIEQTLKDGDESLPISVYPSLRVLPKEVQCWNALPKAQKGLLVERTNVEQGSIGLVYQACRDFEDELSCDEWGSAERLEGARETLADCVFDARLVLDKAYETVLGIQGSLFDQLETMAAHHGKQAQKGKQLDKQSCACLGAMERDLGSVRRDLGAEHPELADSLREVIVGLQNEHARDLPVLGDVVRHQGMDQEGVAESLETLIVAQRQAKQADLRPGR